MLTTCDNLEALRKITVARIKVKTSWKSVDFISQILDIWSQQHCQPSPQHVYGHQDDKGMGPLTFVEHPNVRMDKLTKTLAIQSFGIPPSIPPAVLHLGLGQTVIQGSLVASTIQKSLLYGIHHHAMIQYVANKWELDVNTLQHTVLWPSIAKAKKRASFPFQKFISKWICKDMATGIVMRCRKQCVHDN